MKRYYSAESAHGSLFSMGVANDTIVRVWASKKNRDRYIQETPNISAEEIRRGEVIREATNWSLTNNEHIAPKPFTSEFWGIVVAGDYNELPYGLECSGYLGTVEPCGGRYYNDDAEKFYK